MMRSAAAKAVTTGSNIILPGMRVRIHRFLAGLTGPHGATLNLEFDVSGLDDRSSESTLQPYTIPGDTFDARVIKVYGDHPTRPTKFELRVVREDTGAELYCPVTSVISILPGLPNPPRPSGELTESARYRVRERLIDAICGPYLEVESDPEDVPPPPPQPNIYVRLGTSAPSGPDELPIEL